MCGSIKLLAVLWSTLGGLTLCMLGKFFKIFFHSKGVKNSLFPSIFLPIYNLNVKQFGSQMKPHVLQKVINGLQNSPLAG